MRCDSFSVCHLLYFSFVDDASLIEDMEMGERPQTGDENEWLERRAGDIIEMVAKPIWMR